MILPIGNKQRRAFSVKRLGGRIALSANRYPLTAKQGLSLVEVLLAVSILAMGIVAVLQGYARSITAMEAGQYNIQAVNLLKTKMAEAELSLNEKEEITPGSENGLFEGPFHDFVWDKNVSATDEEHLYKLVLTVSSAEDPRAFSLTTYVADRVEDEE